VSSMLGQFEFAPGKRAGQHLQLAFFSTGAPPLASARRLLGGAGGIGLVLARSFSTGRAEG